MFNYSYYTTWKDWAEKIVSKKKKVEITCIINPKAFIAGSTVGMLLWFFCVCVRFAHPLHLVGKILLVIIWKAVSDSWSHQFVNLKRWNVELRGPCAIINGCTKTMATDHLVENGRFGPFWRKKMPIIKPKRCSTDIFCVTKHSVYCSSKI